MVWYVPPLSPVMGMIEGEGSTADPDDVFPAIDRLRIPVRYLSNLLAAGDDEVIRRVLKQLAAMRRYMRERSLGGEADASVPAAVGMSVDDMDDMYRLLAIAKYSERFVIPTAHAELAGTLSAQQGACGLDFAGGPGGCGANGRATRAEEAGEAFHLAPPPPEPVAHAVAAPEAGCGEGSCGCGHGPAAPAARTS
jgi:nitrate reductase beta subunit